MRQIIIIFCAILLPLKSFAQTYPADAVGKNDVMVGDAWVSRENHTLIIDYNLYMGDNIVSCNVELMMSINGGQTYEIITMSNKLTGDIGRIDASGSKRIVYDIDSVKSQLVGKEIVFKVKVSKKQNIRDSKGKIFVMGTGSTLKMFGLRVGYAKKFGGYISFSDGFNSGNGRFLGSMLGTWKTSIGGIVQIAPWFYSYAGVGYGKLQVNPDDALGNYLDEHVEIYDTIDIRYIHNKYGVQEYNIMPIEVGALFRFSHVTLSCGIEPFLVFSKGLLCTFQFGVGVSF